MVSIHSLATKVELGSGQAGERGVEKLERFPEALAVGHIGYFDDRSRSPRDHVVGQVVQSGHD